MNSTHLYTRIRNINILGLELMAWKLKAPVRKIYAHVGRFRLSNECLVENDAFEFSAT